MNHAEKQKLAIDWLKEKAANGDLDFKTLISMFDILMKQLDVMSISEYGRQLKIRTNEEITYNGVLSRIDSGKLHALSFYGDVLVFEPKKVEIPEYIN